MNHFFNLLLTCTVFCSTGFGQIIDQFFTTNSSLTRIDVLDIAYADNGHIWALTQDTLYVYDGVNWSPIHSGNSSSPFDEYDRVEADTFGNIWLSTSGFDDGLVKFDGTNYTTIFPPNVTDFNTDHLLFEDDKLWVSSLFDHFLMYYDIQNDTWVDVSNKLEPYLGLDFFSELDITVNSIEVGDDGLVYLADGGYGVLVLDDSMVVDSVPNTILGLQGFEQVIAACGYDNVIYISSVSKAFTYTNGTVNTFTSQSNLPNGFSPTNFNLKYDKVNDRLYLLEVDFAFLNQNGWTYFSNTTTNTGGTGVNNVIGCAIAADGSIWYSKFDHSIVHFEPGSAGLSDKNQNITLSVFPNPSENILTVQSTKTIKSLTIYNMKGQIAYQNMNIDRSLFTLQSSLKSGQYLLFVSTRDAIISKSFIVK